MIAKPDRFMAAPAKDASCGLRRAREEMVVEGVKTNIPLHPQGSC